MKKDFGSSHRIRWNMLWRRGFARIPYCSVALDDLNSRAFKSFVNLKFEGLKFSADVPGNQWSAQLIFKAFGNQINAKISEIINASPKFIGQILNRRLSDEFLYTLQSAGIRVFPSNLDELRFRCTCPESKPCSHILGLVLKFGNWLDNNPFLIFEARGTQLKRLILGFDEKHYFQPYCITRLSNPDAPIENQLPEESLQLLNFNEAIATTKFLLKEGSDFTSFHLKQTLLQAYESWKNTALNEVKDPADRIEYILRYFLGPQKEITSLEFFQLKISPEHRLSEITINQNSFSERELDVLNFDFRQLFLECNPNHLSTSIGKFVYHLNLFVVMLFLQQALIPQFIIVSRSQVLIRWIPALFEPNVFQKFQAFVKACPEDFVWYDGSYLKREEQICIAISIFADRLMRKYVPECLKEKKGDLMYDVFFFRRTISIYNKPLSETLYFWLKPLTVQPNLQQYKMRIRLLTADDRLALRFRIGPHNGILKIFKNFLKDLSHADGLKILAELSCLTQNNELLENFFMQPTETTLSEEKFSAFYLDYLPHLKKLGFNVTIPKGFFKQETPKLLLNISMQKPYPEQKSVFNLSKILNFQWKIAVGNQNLSVDEFKTLLKKTRGMIRLNQQAFYIQPNYADALSKILEEYAHGVDSTELLHAVALKNYKGATVQLDEHLERFIHKNHEPTLVPIPKNLKAALRPYQVLGFSWLVQNMELGFGSILADDMGLGKTLQVLTTILYFKNKGLLENKKALIVAPTTLLSNWEKEILRFTPDLKYSIYHGLNRDFPTQFDILITSYGLVRNDNDIFHQKKWFLLVVDEAQNIKNPTTDQTKAIKSIHADHKIAMSGTPIENRLLEYWSIFDLVNKNYLGTEAHFRKNFVMPIENGHDENSLNKFLLITKPFILRRLKSDKSIINDLPEKIENNCYCYLTPKQAALYQKEVDYTLKGIGSAQGITRKGLILKLIHSLKQICNHPAHYSKNTLSNLEESGKMLRLIEILSQTIECQEKAIIFTQYVEMGQILVKVLEKKFYIKIPFLHGGLSRTARDKIVNDFQKSLNTKIMIVSLRAGGTGLNLTEANHVVHYDLWWNPAVESQATDRAYRIGQKRNVIVHRLLTSGTFEEEIDDMLQRKKRLANLALGTNESWITELSNEELRKLVALKQQAYE